MNNIWPEVGSIRELIVQAAKQELLPRFNPSTHRQYKQDGSLVTAADNAIQGYLKAALQAKWPEYAFLGEEMSVAEQQVLLEDSDRGIWCLDPLDGTSNFAAGVPFFAISLALIVGGEIVRGLVYDPIRDECFYAGKGEGAWLNDERLQHLKSERSLSECVAIVDFKRLPSDLAARLVTEPPYSSQRSFGSVALDWCWLAAGRAHVYLHGKQNLWDYAAGTLIFSEAGGYSITLTGEPVYRHALEPRSAVAALDRALFEQWVAYLKIK